MSEEWVIEIESFKSVDDAKKFAKKNISAKHIKMINIVSRNIEVYDLTD